MKSPTTYQRRTLRALERIYFKSVIRELDQEWPLVAVDDHEAPPSYLKILENMPPWATVN